MIDKHPWLTTLFIFGFLFGAEWVAQKLFPL